MMSEERYGKYRSKHEIVRAILGIVSSGPVNATHVMYEAHISWPQLKAYREALIANGLIVINTESHWQVTQKGIEKLKVLEEALA